MQMLRDPQARNELVEKLAAASRDLWQRQGGVGQLLSALGLLLQAVLVASLVIPSSVTEQIASLLPQAFVLGLILHLGAVTAGHKRQFLARAVGGTVSAMALIAVFLSPWSDPGVVQPTPNTFQVTTYNALFTRTEAPRLNPADVIGLQEITRAKLDTVASNVGADYTYLTACDCTAAGTEVGLVSRFEIADAEYYDDGESGTFVRAVLKVAPDKRVVVYLAHFPSPENHTGRDRRNVLLAVIKDRIADESDDVLLMGDLNTTVYSSAFQRIRSELKLQPAGYGIVPACSWHGYGPLLCLRIDHIFVSAGLGIVESSVAHVEGSDHRPVSATVTW